MSFKRQKFFLILIFILLFITILLMSSEPPFGFKIPHGGKGPGCDSNEVSLAGSGSTSEARISGKKDAGHEKRKGGMRLPHEEFISRILEDIPKDQKTGKYETEHCSYTILDTAEAASAITRDILSGGATYFRESDDRMIFFRNLTERPDGDASVIIEMKRGGPERNFIGVIYAKKLIIFSSVLVIAGIAIFFIFVSYRHSVEAQNENQKYQSVKRMSFGLAHEIRNPLNAMHLSLEVLKSNIDDPEGMKKAESAECLDIIGSEIKRLDELVKRFMEYSKEIKLKRARTSVNKLVNSAVLVLAPIAAEKNVKIAVSSDSEFEADIDSDLIYQGFINVIKNAVEAVSVGGSVEVSCEKKAAAASIVVTDDGEGIKPENMPKIFDFYFSTKKEGSGIGLAVTKKFVEAHGGSITASSAAGKTCFTIKLPV